MTEVFEMLKNLFLEMDKIKILLLEKRTYQTIQKEWFDGQEVMQYLHISKRTLQNLRSAEILPYSHIKGKFYYKVADVQTLLESNYSKPSSKSV